MRRGNVESISDRGNRTRDRKGHASELLKKPVSWFPWTLLSRLSCRREAMFTSLSSALSTMPHRQKVINLCNLVFTMPLLIQPLFSFFSRHSSHSWKILICNDFLNTLCSLLPSLCFLLYLGYPVFFHQKISSLELLA